MKDLIVLHETLYPLLSIKGSLATPNELGAYHHVIQRDGQRITFFPNEEIVIACGPSSYEDIRETVDPFSIHIALESPYFSDPEADTHIGYTEAQYRTLASLIHSLPISRERIVYHSHVGEAKDPRSFNAMYFLSLL